MNIQFDKEQHIYTVDGVIRPCVSDILKATGIAKSLDNIPADILERARAFGEAVHSTTELWDRQDLDESCLDDQLKPYLEQWKLFIKNENVKILPEFIEYKIFHPEFEYCGTIDRIVKIRKNNYILDIKTSKKIYPSNRIQLSAYQLAILQASNEDCGRILLRLSADNYKMDILDNSYEDREIWLSAIKIYNYLKGEK